MAAIREILAVLSRWLASRQGLEDFPQSVLADRLHHWNELLAHLQLRIQSFLICDRGKHKSVLGKGWQVTHNSRLDLLVPTATGSSESKKFVYDRILGPRSVPYNDIWQAVQQVLQGETVVMFALGHGKDAKMRAPIKEMLTKLSQSNETGSSGTDAVLDEKSGNAQHLHSRGLSIKVERVNEDCRDIIFDEVVEPEAMNEFFKFGDEVWAGAWHYNLHRAHAGVFASWQWHVRLDDDWQHVAELPATPGAEAAYNVGRENYRGSFRNSMSGVQHNIFTGTKRDLVRLIKPAARRTDMVSGDQMTFCDMCQSFTSDKPGELIMSEREAQEHWHHLPTTTPRPDVCTLIPRNGSMCECGYAEASLAHHIMTVSTGTANGGGRLVICCPASYSHLAESAVAASSSAAAPSSMPLDEGRHSCVQTAKVLQDIKDVMKTLVHHNLSHLHSDTPADEPLVAELKEESCHAVQEMKNCLYAAAGNPDSLSILLVPLVHAEQSASEIARVLAFSQHLYEDALKAQSKLHDGRARTGDEVGPSRSMRSVQSAHMDASPTERRSWLSI